MRAAVFTTLVLAAATARADLAGGVRVFREGRYADAARLLANDGSDPQALFFEGAALYKLHQPEAAYEDIDEALEREPALAGEVGELYLGLVLYDLQLYRGCRAAFERVMQINPGGRLASVASAHLAALQRLTGDPHAAATFYLNHGLGYAAKARPRLAEAFLEEARSLDPRLRPELVGLHLAAALNALGRPAEALAAVGKLVGAGPDLQRGRALVALGHVKQGRQALAKSAASGTAPWAAAAKVLLESTR